MKIAQVTKYFYPHRGGIESHILGISKVFANEGCKVLVYTSNEPAGKGFEVVDGLKVYRSGVFFTLFNGPFSPGIFINLMKGDYDLIHVHLPDPFNSVFALAASKLKKKPLFVTYHADIIKEKGYHKPFKIIYGLFLNSILKNAKTIIATTPNYVAGSQIPEKYRSKVRIVPNFVDTVKFSPGIDGSRIRDLYSMDGKKAVYFLGRLVPYKGVEYLIKAFKDVKEKVSDSVLIISGKGPLEAELKKLVSDLGVEDVLFVHAPDAEIPEYYAACDLFVLPSVTRQEAFGIALLEAMACGKPTVTTSISGMPYVVGNAGLTVEPRDPEQLSAAIVKILSDKDLAAGLGRKARERVEKEFREDLVARKILELYKSA